MAIDKTTEIKPLLIAQVEAPQDEGGGDYYYRTYSPGIAMAQEEGVYAVNLTNVHRQKEEVMMEADVLILKNICDPDMMPLIKKRKKQKKLSVYELADDICGIPPWNPVHFFYKNKENLLLFKRLAKYCDAMQFSVPELKRIYGYLNPTTAVFPNQISIVPPERKSKNRKEIIIGWGGSHGHFEDIAEVSGPLIDWIIRRDNIRLYLMCSDPIWLLFNSLPNAKKRRFKPGSLSDYYAFLTKLDIGLAPLKNTAFNRSRSDIKFLEYAAHGVVPVLQALVPYDSTARHGETGFLFKDGPELLSVLEILTVNKNGDLLSKTAKSSRKYVLMERLQNYHSGERIGFYRDQLGRLQRGQREKKTVCGIFKDLSGIEGVVRNDRHLRLMPTNFERLLHDGLVLSQLEGKTDLARSIFLKASQLEPANYLPYLFGASCSGDAIDWLNSAIERNPDSLKSWTMLGEEYSKKGDPINAVRCFDSAAKIFSDYEIPYLRTAALLNTVGHYKESHFLAQKARALISSLEA